ncbi:hypothetical protein G3N57_26770, partial [Paraburkholderia sp. Se-20369]|nr:hypothetical protein [Paraburkholderia sp. Se-20369]
MRLPLRFGPAFDGVSGGIRGDKVALGGDGQVTLGNIVMKGGARKVRRIYNNQVLVGFAGG